MTITEYRDVASGGYLPGDCPKCGSDRLRWGDPVLGETGEELRLTGTCEACRCDFTEIYTLLGVEYEA